MCLIVCSVCLPEDNGLQSGLKDGVRIGRYSTSFLVEQKFLLSCIIFAASMVARAQNRYADNARRSQKTGATK